ncbi:MAG: ABC transporter substrate-binding protein [Candidatus Rokubacteria bacterium]|nr:ABC transporter substrate-binding protein [Candidatus Rokubacteria bacterium]
MGTAVLRRCGWVCSVLPVLLVLLAPTGARSQSMTTTIRYGAPTATPDITTVSVYFAIENGLFKREGLEVQVMRYPGSTTAIRALLSGDADVVETGGDTALLAMESGAAIQILLSPVARSTDVVVAKSSVASLADMKDKRFAVSAPGSPGDVLGRLLFQRHGVDPGQIQFVALGSPADRIRALLGGKVDATSATILVIQPVLEAIAKGEVRTLASMGEQFPAIPLSYVVATQTFIKSHRDAVVRLVRAQIEGLRWAQAHPDDAARIAVKYIRETPLPILTEGMREMARMKVYGLDGGISERGVEETQQALKQLGRVKSVSKATEVAAFDLLQEALKPLGPVR